MKTSITLFLVASLWCSTGCTDIGTGRITPVPFDKVTLEEGFWSGRMETEISTTVPFSLTKCRPAIERFAKCVNLVEGRSDELPVTHRFISSDMYKVLEGAAYSLMIRPNPDVGIFRGVPAWRTLYFC